MRDLVGETWDDMLPHVIEDIEQGAFEIMNMQDLLDRIVALEAETRRLAERVKDLEYCQQQKQDEEGYAEQGSRYHGRHPRTCACDRCLQRQFGS
jgi:hypothetical protein